MKPIVCLVWPKHCDYPVFRYNMKRFKDYFQDIFIGFTYHYQEEDYSNFIRADLDAKFIDIKHGQDQDWRDEGINQLLDLMPPTEHVLFIEQDFLIKDGTFFDKLFKEDHDFIYYMEGSRIHPAFALVKRDLIERTSRDFSAVHPKDHFGKFFDELGLLTQGQNIEDLGVVFKEDFYHMAGLTQNYQCFKYQDPFFRPNTFFYFNHKSSLLPHQSPFVETMRKINQFDRPKQHEFLDNFFPD